MVNLIVIIPGFDLDEKIVGICQESVHDPAALLRKLVSLNETRVKSVIDENAAVFGPVGEVGPIEAVSTVVPFHATFDVETLGVLTRVFL